MARADAAGVDAHRAATAAAAKGRVLEIGAGTGLNLGLYGGAVSELVLTEPSDPMSARLRERLAQLPGGPPTRVVTAAAERLPFPDESFDTVVSTLVLCTVPDLPAALAEVHRVVKPGGRFLFLEHVRSEDPRFAAWQDRLHGPWLLVGNGCHCNRETVAEIRAAGFAVEELHSDVIPELALARPLARGAATLA